ncbi:MAG: SGNH/GDSL hydrolase family protein [Clostridia bacterium]|nr:SGNH/GDSL hydrolase family protein [Clostridia bacterium]
MKSGDRVIIIGNSYVYNGNAVVNIRNSEKRQSVRENDHGYFYQLCKANGIDVNVTNWCFGGHGLADLFAQPCSRKECDSCRHEEFLLDRYYDYVIVSPGGGARQESTIKDDFDSIISFFRAANPDVVIVCLGNLGARGYSSFGTVHPGVYEYYPTLRSKGVIIADWGEVVSGITNGVYAVHGANEAYCKSSFIVDDGFHPNPLSGYIAALTAYCAITGESAVGQPRSFFSDALLCEGFDMEKYTARFYRGESNFMQIMNSDSDMRGIALLIDQAVAKYTSSTR